MAMAPPPQGSLSAVDLGTCSAMGKEPCRGWLVGAPGSQPGAALLRLKEGVADGVGFTSRPGLLPGTGKWGLHGSILVLEHDLLGNILGHGFFSLSAVSSADVRNACFWSWTTSGKTRNWPPSGVSTSSPWNPPFLILTVLTWHARCLILTTPRPLCAVKIPSSLCGAGLFFPVVVNGAGPDYSLCLLHISLPTLSS